MPIAQPQAPTRLADSPAPLNRLIARRWSPRAFDPELEVSPDHLRTVLEAARWAPSSFNEQPWRFLIGSGQHPEFRETLRDLLMEGNAWARRAPVLVLSGYSTHLSRNGKPNRMALRDLGAAEENLLLQATELGLIAHQMAGFDADAARALLPDGVEVGAMTALGWYGDPSDLTEGQAKAEKGPRKRKPLDEIVGFGGLGPST